MSKSIKFKPGDLVRTTADSGSTDWSGTRKCRWLEPGQIEQVQLGHGPVFLVRHQDDSLEWYEEQELMLDVDQLVKKTGEAIEELIDAKIALAKEDSDEGDVLRRHAAMDTLTKMLLNLTRTR